MNIAVCDREACMLELVKTYLSWTGLSEEFGRVDCFENEDTMLLGLKENAYDIFIMGTYVEGIKKFGRVIELRDNVGMPVSYEWFCRKLVLLWKALDYDFEPYVGMFRGRFVCLELDEIYYFEAAQRITHVYTREDKYRVNGSLKSEYKKLPDYRFAYVNQGTLVNLQHVKRMEPEKIYLRNNMEFFPSIRNARELSKKLKLYYKVSKIMQI